MSSGAIDIEVPSDASDVIMAGDANNVDLTNRDEGHSSALRAIARAATGAATSLPFPIAQLALVGGTILPPPFAQLVTALSLGTRVSLRVTAFFLEAMLESSRCVI